jgi:hypothetical protein
MHIDNVRTQSVVATKLHASTAAAAATLALCLHDTSPTTCYTLFASTIVSTTERNCRECAQFSKTHESIYDNTHT